MFTLIPNLEKNAPRRFLSCGLGRFVNVPSRAHVVLVPAKIHLRLSSYLISTICVSEFDFYPVEPERRTYLRRNRSRAATAVLSVTQCHFLDNLGTRDSGYNSWSKNKVSLTHSTRKLFTAVLNSYHEYKGKKYICCVECKCSTASRCIRFGDSAQMERCWAAVKNMSLKLLPNIGVLGVKLC
jgi:hypothetical protein